MVVLPPIEHNRRAAAHMRDDNSEAALRQIEEGLRDHPGNPDLLNSSGNILRGMGRLADAVDRFGQASKAAPQRLDFAINHAIILGQNGRPHAAIAALVPHETAGRNDPRYCSTRAATERAADNSAEAQLWYDRCLMLDPAHQKARHGRARIALERGQADALTRFDHAISSGRGDADLWLGKAQSLDIEGRSDEARQIAEVLVEQGPQWLEGLQFLAQLRLAAGEDDFTSHYVQASAAVPDDPAIVFAHITQLAGLDYFADAADLANSAQSRFPKLEQFRLLEAVQSGAAGDIGRAETLFATMSINSTERHLHEARHRIRRSEWKRASNSIDHVIVQEPWDGAAWALRGIVWRETDEAKAQWLHGQDGLVQMIKLENADGVLADVGPILHRLHDISPLPLGQSLRGGTQTRSILFSRAEPEIDELQQGITAAIEAYQSALPPVDPTHPLLRHRDRKWDIKGSWSVRLSGGGDYHTAHVHPLGIISSALYIEVPDCRNDADRAGWLELGRPPGNLCTDQAPLHQFEPQPGRLVLFPSTVYHGTRPFASGRRMSVAFDVTIFGDTL